MGTLFAQNANLNRRTENRTSTLDYYSVQFFVAGLESDYQFKLRDISPGGLSILIGENSPVLNHIHVGDILEMVYYPEKAQHGRRQIKTRIQHITRNDAGRYAGHCIVGLQRLDGTFQD